MVGDVVEVVNSQDKTVAADNGLGGWNMPWTAWVMRLRHRLTPQSGDCRTGMP